MQTKQLKNIIEAALLSAAHPLEINDLLRVFEEDERPQRKALLQVIDELAADYEDRALELKKVASGYRLQVRKDYGPWLGRITGQRVPRYSRALLETLALVAYRQPVTRGEIENVRGVSVSSNIVRTLLERGWVRIVGHRDVPGRPAMLGTTKEFLDYFNLQSLDELPSLAELKDFDSINVELDFDSPVALAAPESGVDSESDIEALMGPEKDTGGIELIGDLEAEENAAADDAEATTAQADSQAQEQQEEQQDELQGEQPEDQPEEQADAAQLQRKPATS